MATTKEVLDHHITCFGEGDLEGILTDYAPGAVFFMETMAMKAPQVVCGTCTAITFGKLRLSALRISPSRVMQETRM